MTDPNARARCGNDPRAQLTDGDRQAVADFRAYLSARAGLRDKIVNALGQIKTVPPVAHRREQADHVLAVLYREWPWLRTEAEEGESATPSVLRDRITEALLTTRRTDYADHNVKADHRNHRYDARCALCAYDVDALAAAVLAMLPAPTDRAAVLREAADRYAALVDQNEAYELAEHGQIDHETSLQFEAVRDVVTGLRRMADETQPETETPTVTVHAVPLPGSNGISACCGRPPCEFVGERVTHAPDEVTCPGPPADAPAQERQDDPWPVQEATRRYAEELRANPSAVVADGHTGWECDAGASLIVEARTPGPGRLGTHHGVIYACPAHRDAAVERIASAGYEVDPRPAPPGHRWNPWPCGHVTAHGSKAMAALTAAQAQQDGAQS
ncbi:hypothetical protein [Streptomyces longwoodensis]|uniref:hypothetical protein n=1 Tax=Streptomyces longwoodensis TaxID=68231 RepID=UPI002256A123|nr:hypothetical protein [Streptomyces longwoodensis]MCX4993814.1 hypothetical protein [Streptomyces longwoodensis]MCX4998066.1 hypothetical protein [Streptomyces longwoodensis]